MQLAKGLTLAVITIVPIVLSAGEPGKLREIEVKGAKIAGLKGRPSQPTFITNADELRKAIPGTDAGKLKVDFAKDKLLLFAWSGSGGDKLTGKLSDDGKTATFTRKPGLTRDLRPHVKLFAIPISAEFQFQGK